MHFELNGSLDGDVLVVAFGGRLSASNATEMVLADVRGLEGKVSAGRVYFLVRDLPQPVPQGIKTAFLDRTERAEQAHFLESTAHNAGVELKAFVDPDAAMAWLRAS